MKTDCVKPPSAHSHTQISWESVMHVTPLWCHIGKWCLFKLDFQSSVFSAADATSHLLDIDWKESCLDFVFSMMWLSNKVWFASVIFPPHLEMLKELDSERDDMNCNTEDLHILKDGICVLSWMCCSESCLQPVLCLISVSLTSSHVNSVHPVCFIGTEVSRLKITSRFSH